MNTIPTRTATAAIALKKIPGKPLAACISSFQVRQNYRTLTTGVVSKATQTSTSPGREAVARRRSCTDKHTPVHKATFSTATHVAMNEPTIHELFEPVTSTWQYVVADPTTHHAVIIDPVLNYDASKGVITTESADMILNMVAEKSYKIEMILETHAHADHLTAASYIQATLAKNPDHRPLIGIGGRIKQVQQLFGQRYGVGADEYENVFDKLFEDDEEFEIGAMTARAIHLPGHTPDHMGYKIGSNVFVGDSIFHADIGSARADFPGGSATAIFNSCRKLLAMPDETKIWVGHDYPPAGRAAPVPFMTVQQQKQENKHVKEGTLEKEFVEMRQKRDETLAAPRLIHPSLQINIRAGKLPAPTAFGDMMVHLPLMLPGGPW